MSRQVTNLGELLDTLNGIHGGLSYFSDPELGDRTPVTGPRGGKIHVDIVEVDGIPTVQIG